MNQKYHHLIPRTYLKSWCYSNKSIYVFNKEKRKYETKNIENNFGITQFHSIVAGMPICEENDLKKIFECLEGYDVYCKGKLLKSLKEYNEEYYLFDEWCIKKNEKELKSKEKNLKKSQINKVKILEIENLWSSKYESKWDMLKNIIEDRVLNNNNHQVDEFYKGLLMRSLVAFNWRGFYGNEMFKSAYKWISNLVELDTIDIPIEERIKGYLETGSDEMEHYILLHKYREFLRDTGVIYDMAKNYIKLMNVKFYVTQGKNKFITSDNPSFISDNLEGKKVHIMPITPKILIVAGIYPDNQYNKKYLIDYVEDKEVKAINKIIFNNSIERVISSDKNLKLCLM